MSSINESKLPVDTASIEYLVEHFGINMKLRVMRYNNKEDMISYINLVRAVPMPGLPELVERPQSLEPEELP